LRFIRSAQWLVNNESDRAGASTSLLVRLVTIDVETLIYRRDDLSAALLELCRVAAGAFSSFCPHRPAAAVAPSMR
jgi:hypothetical protein